MERDDPARDLTPYSGYRGAHTPLILWNILPALLFERRGMAVTMAPTRLRHGSVSGTRMAGVELGPLMINSMPGGRIALGRDHGRSSWPRRQRFCQRARCGVTSSLIGFTTERFTRRGIVRTA